MFWKTINNSGCRRQWGKGRWKADPSVISDRCQTFSVELTVKWRMLNFQFGRKLFCIGMGYIDDIWLLFSGVGHF